MFIKDWLKAIFSNKRVKELEQELQQLKDEFDAHKQAELEQEDVWDWGDDEQIETTGRQGQ